MGAKKIPINKLLTRAHVERAISEVSLATTPNIRVWLHTNFPQLEFGKRDLNELLYSMLDEGLLVSNGAKPPVWSSVFTEEPIVIDSNDNNKDHEFTLVIIDCDNRPECYKSARGYANKNRHVVGVASSTYNGWRPPLGYDKFGAFIQDSKGCKQYVKSFIPFFIAQFLAKQEAQTTVVIASGDKTMQTIAGIARDLYTNHEFVVVQTLKQLILEIE